MVRYTGTRYSAGSVGLSNPRSVIHKGRLVYGVFHMPIGADSTWQAGLDLVIAETFPELRRQAHNESPRRTRMWSPADADRQVRIVDADGELLRELVLDPTRDYQRQSA